MASVFSYFSSSRQTEGECPQQRRPTPPPSHDKPKHPSPRRPESLKICIVLTNVSRTDKTNKPTGFDIRELAHICEMLLHARYYFEEEGRSSDKGDLKQEFAFLSEKLIFATLKGGEAPIAPDSLTVGQQDLVTKEFLGCQPIMEQIKNTERWTSLRPAEFDGLIFPGGHGPLFDLASSVEGGDWIREFYEMMGVIAAVCHGPAAFLSVKVHRGGHEDPNAGEAWIKDMAVTCQSDEEEKKMHYDQDLPYLLEDRLRETGAKVKTGGAFEPFVVTTGDQDRLVTGQNSESVRPMMRTFIKKLIEMKRS